MSSLKGRIKLHRLPPGVEVRLSEEEDGKYWAEWLTDEEVLRWYPVDTEEECKESVSRMQAYAKYKCSLTALYHGEVAGIAYLNLHPYRKIAHQCIFTVIVGKKFRGQGIGRVLCEELEKLARDSYRVQMLHLEVYEGNPAIRLYRRLGYYEFGYQSHWIKESEGHYRGKIFMDKWL